MFEVTSSPPGARGAASSQVPGKNSQKTGSIWVKSEHELPARKCGSLRLCMEVNAPCAAQCATSKVCCLMDPIHLRDPAGHPPGMEGASRPSLPTYLPT